MSSWINPRSNVVQRNWQPAVLSAARVTSKPAVDAAEGRGDPPPSAAFDLWREQQVLHSNSFTREFQTRKLMRQFFSKTHTLGSAGPATMVVSHRFRVDVVSTDARFVAGFTLGRGHSVRLMFPDSATWDQNLCSSSLALSDEGERTGGAAACRPLTPSAGRTASASKISSCEVSLPVCALLLDTEFCIHAQIVEGDADSGGMLSMGIATRDAAGWSGGFVKGFGLHRRSVSSCCTLALRISCSACVGRLTINCSGACAAEGRRKHRPQRFSSAQELLEAHARCITPWRGTLWLSAATRLRSGAR